MVRWMGQAVSNGNEAKREMKNPSDFEPTISKSATIYANRRRCIGAKRGCMKGITLYAVLYMYYWEVANILT